MQTEIVPRLPAAPVKSARGVPADIPCALAVVNTLGVAAVTELMAIAVPVPSTKRVAPIAGNPAVVVPSDANENGLSTARPCAVDVVIIAVAMVLTVMASRIAALLTS